MISRFIGNLHILPSPTAEPAAARTAPILLPKFTFRFLHKNYQIIINQHWLACKSIKLIVLLRRITKN